MSRALVYLNVPGSIRIIIIFTHGRLVLLSFIVALVRGWLAVDCSANGVQFVFLDGHKLPAHGCRQCGHRYEESTSNISTYICQLLINQYAQVNLITLNHLSKFLRLLLASGIQGWLTRRSNLQVEERGSIPTEASRLYMHIHIYVHYPKIFDKLGPMKTK